MDAASRVTAKWPFSAASGVSADIFIQPLRELSSFAPKICLCVCKWTKV